MFILFLIILIGGAIYLYKNDGGFFIYSNHFEVGISKDIIIKAIEESKKNANKCKVCDKIIDEGEFTCKSCQKKELESYYSSNKEELRETKNLKDRIALPEKFEIGKFDDKLN